MKIINLTVVVYGRYCSTARVYLEYLKNAGYKPRRIILILDTGVSLKGKLIRHVFGRQVGVFLKELIFLNGMKPIMSLCEMIQDHFDLEVNLLKKFNFEDYTCKVNTVYVKGFDDSIIVDALKKDRYRNFLYTCGNRVKNEWLSINSIKIFHIHPGVVPYVKGSDGLYWSLLIRGVPGTSCFYMNIGIDTGSVIDTYEFQVESLNIDVSNYSNEDLNKAVLYAYDPHFRGRALIRVLDKYVNTYDLKNFPSKAQRSNEGQEYFHMHKNLKKLVLRNLIFLQS